MPPVGSSIHFYQVPKKGGTRHDAIMKQGNTWSIVIFNSLMQRYGFAESLDGGKDNMENSDGDENKDNSMAAMVVNINEDIFYLTRLP